ncbi:prephenate dehydratase [uncultured Desulfovibrio sp.]|uniref:prephenate dehydratase n=1 Tax=uncultured Desulfovibrio sp. TaxID=167968 RepID=UPI002635F596|nr:prephenate dehydratase [uncultured Desulfovibrio sp.]
MDDSNSHWPKGHPVAAADRQAASPDEAGARLAAIRHEIDAVDQDLLTLFNQRAALSLEVGRIKADVPGIIFKPLREKEVLDSLATRNPGPLPEDHLRAIWREIFSSSRSLQRPQNVAYLGPEGTFSYFAGVEYLGHAAQFRPCNDITQVFQEVASGQCELGVVPLENSLQGTVGVSFDLFLKYDVHIQAELFSRISHCLLSNAPSLASVRTVYSHPQPLAQCGAWLRAHLPGAGLVPVESTAAAAQFAAGKEDAAAIGHGKLADLMGIAVLARRIEDEPGNWTRFVIIGPGDARSGSRTGGPQPGHTGADKTSLLFTTADKAGALSSVLDLLASNGINMRKLESRPLRGQRWKYVFFADVESDLEDPRYAPLLEKLHEVCTSFRILGSYPTGPQLDRLDLHSETPEQPAS